MSNQENLSKVNFFDRLNASTLSLVTWEMPRLRRARKRNNYPDKPTFAQPAPMPFQQVEIDGVDIRYAHAAAPDKPTLLMLCPFPQSILAYAPIWADLAARFNLYALDLPGFGRSGGGLEFMTFKAQGDFLQQFMTHFDINNAHIVAPDVGMPSALYYVGTHANTVRSLLIGDGPAIAPSANASVIRKMVDWGFWRLVFLVAGAGALIEAGNRICYVNYRPNEEEVSDYLKSYKGRIGAVLQWFKGYPESLATVDPLLAEIQLPTLVFWGDEDAILYPDNGERVVARMPNAELKLFKDCGHFCYQDRHEEFRDMVIDWVGKQEG